MWLENEKPEKENDSNDDCNDYNDCNRHAGDFQYLPCRRIHSALYTPRVRCTNGWAF